MITLEPIGHVRSSRTDLSDDNRASLTARIELVEALPSESLDGIETFSHAEVVYFFDRVPDAEVERGARHPRGIPPGRRWGPSPSGGRGGPTGSASPSSR
jgi:tRNA (Thr-GGU) A37 N-methylase